MLGKGNAMDLLIPIIMVACCAVLVGSGVSSLPVMLGILSIDLIAAFAVMMVSDGAGLSILFFAIDLLVVPWVVFVLVMKRVVPQRREDAAD